MQPTYGLMNLQLNFTLGIHMTQPIAEKSVPKLLKSRMRNTKIYVFCVVLVIIFSSNSIASESPLHEIFDFTGYFLVALCALGRLYCSGFIGGLKNERVIRSGPYSVVRNPLYVFSFLGVVGIGLQSGLITAFVLLVGGFLFYYPSVVKREEEFLAHKFGEDYVNYCHEVPRWIPNFRLWNEPEEIALRPKFLRRTFFDSMVFFLPLPAFEALEHLHAAGYISFLKFIP
jgi:protein-S-isoprenylcysteine O-methyltransferase Ste14